MTAVLARTGVLLVLLCFAVPSIAEAKTTPPPKAHAAACQLLGGRLVPVGAQERHLTTCLEGTRMSGDLKACLTSVGITIPFVAIGGIIGGVAARSIAGTMVGGGGLACVNAIR
jgi:hypothetical protein